MLELHENLFLVRVSQWIPCLLIGLGEALAEDQFPTVSDSESLSGTTVAATVHSSHQPAEAMIATCRKAEKGLEVMWRCPSGENEIDPSDGWDLDFCVEATMRPKPLVAGLEIRKPQEAVRPELRLYCGVPRSASKEAKVPVQ